MSKYNRGIVVKVGVTGGTAITLETLNYQPSWETITETFEKQDFSTYSIYKGARFSATVTTGLLNKTNADTLRAALLKHQFEFTCPEFPNGTDVILTSLSYPTAADLEPSSIYAGQEWYQITFAVQAVSLMYGDGV